MQSAWSKSNPKCNDYISSAAVKVFEYENAHVSLCVCVYTWFWNNVFSSSCIIETLYEQKQTILSNDRKISTLQAKVEELEATSSEKDTLFAKYEVIVKESEGENTLDIIKYTYDVNFPVY